MLLFVYGTLKPGFYNHERCGSLPFVRDGKGEPLEVYAFGKMFYAPEHDAYPVAQFGDTCERIFGNLLIVEPADPRAFMVLQMEAGAGYVPVPLVVHRESDNGDHAMPEPALGWHYPYAPGEQIKSGRWED